MEEKPMSKFTFPVCREEVRIETGFMKHIEELTLGTYNSSGVIVWTGSSGLGKTTTALWMKDRIEEAYSDDIPDAFRAKHYQSTQLDDRPSVEKAAMKSFHLGILGPLDNGLYRRVGAQELAEHIVTALIKKRIGIAFVDEAGLCCVNAIRALIAVRDLAVKKGHRLTMVLIGMDDLPIKLEANAQVYGRIKEWCFFQPYSLEETADLALEVSDLWEGADLDDLEVKRQMAMLHQVTGGVPGLLVPFLEKVEKRLARSSRELSAAFLMGVHQRSLNAQTKARQAARGNYSFPTSNGGNGRKKP